MAFLRRLFGNDASTDSNAPGAPRERWADLGDIRGDLPEDAVKLLSGVGGVQIVGESHYRAAIDRVVGGRRAEGIRMTMWATLVPESDNQYDPSAVAVHLSGAKVGHLSRSDARRYRPSLERVRAAGRSAYCRADLRGGWERSKSDSGDYGVTVYIDDPAKQDDLLNRLLGSDGPA